MHAADSLYTNMPHRRTTVIGQRYVIGIGSTGGPS